MRHLMILLAALVIGAAPAVAAEQSFYVIVYSDGPNWKPGKPLKEQGLSAHAAYMQSLVDGHRLFVAGPLLDVPGGLVIFKAASMDDARDVLAHDPAVIGGILKGDVHSWRDAFDAGATPDDFLKGP